MGDALNQELIDRELDNFIFDNSEKILSEMTDDESRFLLLLLRTASPKKILEIGVAAGGTTKLILEKMGDDSRLYSVDTSKNYYKNTDKKTGYVASDNVSADRQQKWKKFFGVDIVDCMETIGSGVDFLILDTAHVLPGEMLSFLAVVPFLKDNCVVVLHDISYSYWTCRDRNYLLSCDDDEYKYNIHAYCTNLLFNGVSTKTRLTLRMGIPNIGGFIFDEFTKENIISVFSLLLIHWHYFPDKSTLEKYSHYINNYYDIRCQEYFGACLSMQRAIHECNNKLFEGRKWTNLAEHRDELDSYSKIVFFGAGSRFTSVAKDIKKYVASGSIVALLDNDPLKNGLEIASFTVKSPDKLVTIKPDLVVITSTHYQKILQQLEILKLTFRLSFEIRYLDAIQN
jgi:predicted O-methyltransferase YrrM